MARVCLEGVTKSYTDKGGRSLLALDQLSVDVEDGEFVCILGPSGCGKSTALNIIAGILLPSSGRVTVNGQPLKRRGTGEPGSKVRLGYVFQQPRLMPWKTVRENLCFALDNARIAHDEWDRLIAKNVALVGLGGFEHSYPHQLSGGMQQRAAIARAFAIDPDLLLMDEPFSGLDELTARKMRMELLDIWSTTRKTILFVTHNAFEATFLADRILMMTKRPGRVYKEVLVQTIRPREYEDEDLFREYKGIVETFLTEMGEPLRRSGGGAGKAVPPAES